ncbi:corticosteroid-binding globulin [Acomys russatus]|uniref:corticosteroid-binding globulin n=1 Tax=Acomys russatus TaxID=60746 RepID=UPI0021E33493|nr:corticosteroid-binding globulin [Acomys russatus]
MRLVLYICLLWLSTSGLCKDHNTTYTADCSRSHYRRLAATNVDFAFNLYQQLAALNPDENVLISPVGISIALAMLSLGPWGHTQPQLLQGMGFNLTETPEAEVHQDFQHLFHLLKHSDTGLEMKIHNTIFSDQKINLHESFKENIKYNYTSEFSNIPFKKWIKDAQPAKSETQGGSAQMSSNLDSSATLVLLNDNVLKGMWELPFNPENTKKKDFYVLEKHTATVPMMVQSSNIGYLDDSEIPCEVVKMKSVGNGTTFLILPKKGQMNTVTAALHRDTIDRWDRLLTTRQVTLYVPKFSMSSNYDLKDVLAGKGIEALVTNQSDSGISGTSTVVHKTTLHVDESSALPVATKGVPLPTTSEPPVTIMFNRPFIVVMFDDCTWNSMVMSRIMNPT